MKRNKFIATAALVFMIFCVPVLSQAGDDLVQSVADGCQTELDTYCKDVTPGEGRVLACLYSRGDKLSGKCEYSLYDAAVQLERAIAVLSYLVNECRDDMVKLCSDIAAGEGRVMECLSKNEGKVSDRCKQAFKEVEQN